MEYVDLQENLSLAYEQGSTDAYYGKIKLGPNKKLDNYNDEETRWYWKGYGDAIFGEKDYESVLTPKTNQSKVNLS